MLGPLLVVQWLALLALAAHRPPQLVALLPGRRPDLLLHRRVAVRALDAADRRGRLRLVVPAHPIAGLPATTCSRACRRSSLLNTLVLLPVALLAVYGIASRIAGRVFGYWAAALWIAVPYVAIPLCCQRYHGKYVEQTLPQTLRVDRRWPTSPRWCSCSSARI